MSTEFLQLLGWLVVLAIGIFLYYSGLLQDVHVLLAKPPIPGTLDIFYIFGRGPYHKVRAPFQELEKLAPDAKLVGVYYDDPQSVEASELRWACGAIVKVNGELVVSGASWERLEGRALRRHQLPNVEEAVVAEFPFTTFLSLLIAVRRVYGYVRDFLKENKITAYPALEFYFDQKIHFCLPKSRHDEFFVPESL